MFIGYADSLGRVSPNKSIKIDNVIINVTDLPEEPASFGWRNYSALIALDSPANWGQDHMKVFQNVYVMGTKYIGLDNTASTLVQAWKDMSTNVEAYVDADLTQAVGAATLADLITTNGSIWNYVEGKLLMKNAGESVALI